MTAKWRIGDRIEGRWEIHNILAGGMGIVYIVYDHELREPFAAKTFRDDIFALNPGIAASFKQEALAWVNLDFHPNVVRAREVHTFEGKPFLFLEYVSGGDLDGWIGRRRLAGDLPQALRFACQFCDGMSHAMSKGIKAHRDIKPQNCLITRSRKLKVTDFGLAKVFDDVGPGESRGLSRGEERKPQGGFLYRLLGGRKDAKQPEPGRAGLRKLSIGQSRTGAIAGTCTHMAPEQFDDAKHVDVRADIYSFGVMLFQMVTGRLPFEGRTWQEFERLHKAKLPPSLAPEVPSGLIDVIKTCLAKDPSRRFADFTTVRERLSHVHGTLTGEPASQPAAGVDLSSETLSTEGVKQAVVRLPGGEPSDPVHMLFKKAMNLAELARDDEAIACLDRAIEIDPRSAYAWRNKGFVLANLERTEEAIACFDRAIEISPRHKDSWYNKGVALADLERFEEAITCWDGAIEIDPHYESAWYNKGVTLADLGRSEEAMACLDRAIEINRDSLKVWGRKGLALRNLGRFEEAITCFDRAIELDLRDAGAWGAKGLALKDLGRFEEAVVCFERAIQIDPGIAEDWCDKGTALRMLGRTHEALACFEKAHLLGDPNAASAIEALRKELGHG